MKCGHRRLSKREKSNGKQNYLCTRCGRQFISDHDISCTRRCRHPEQGGADTLNRAVQTRCQGCHSWMLPLIKIMLIRRIGIRDISTVLNISITKVLKALKSRKYRIQPKRTHYDCLEIDKF